MNTEISPPLPELESLLSELIDGTLDESSRLQLCEILRNNPVAQDAYRRLMTVHVLLHLDLGSGRQMTLRPLLASSPLFDTLGDSSSCGTCAEFVAEIDAQLESQQFDGTESMRVAGSPGPRWRTRRLAVMWVGIAASLLLAAWLFSPSQTRQERARAAAREEFIQRDARGVAVLAQAADASWSHTDEALEVGGPLTAGRFQLERGLVQIEFFSGATVVVEAPADFELTTPMELVCHLGKIRANVPSQAHGFKIETPKYSAVDLGTEFTVHVGNDGESEIHVLEGEVELWDRQAKEAELAQLLTTGRGVRTTPSGDLSPIVNSASNFFGRQECLVLSQAVSQERFERWKTFSNGIRNDPRVIFYYGFDGHAPWERVLHNDSSNTDEMLDGAIVGCQWTTGRWIGKQALEFKRTSDRVRLNVPGKFESVSLAAWVRIEGLERWLSSLMLTDGHQPGEVHWQMTELGQMLLGVKAEVDQSHDFYSPSVLSPRDLGRWVHLGCVYNGAKGYVAHYVDGAEISREKVRIPTKLKINAAEIGNWVPEDMLDNRVRSLNGRMDEFILFDGALSNADISRIYEAGKLQ
jgi:hypothetical protein